MKSTWMLAVASLVSVVALEARGMILPENDLYLQDAQMRMLGGGLTKAEFNEAIDPVTKIFTPIVAKHGGKLKMNKNWDDPTVNAYAQQSGKTWSVNMFGGLARRVEVTQDGMSLVVCHELGHHLSGYFFYDNDADGGNGWAGGEGSSDYFATHACAWKIWKNQTAKNAKFRTNVEDYVKERCDKQYTTEADQNLCYRIAAGGQSLANLLGALGGTGEPKFDTPDETVVEETDTSHPAAQCRLDTYFQGALCTTDHDFDVIPGKGLKDGQNTAEAEAIALKSSCAASKGDELGNRPLCWFKPLVEKEESQKLVNGL